MNSRKYDVVMRKREFTEVVYGGEDVKPQDLQKSTENYYPEESSYKIYWGELHGHTDQSDATPTVDEYFKTAREKAKLDFCAISDHDHGGVGNQELWKGKWDYIQKKVKEYNQPDKFVTILAYERDSYPWYNNLVLYYKNSTGEMFRGKVDGEITRDELKKLLNRKDILVVPHTTSFLNSGCDFESIPDNLMSPLIEVYSRWGTSEYFGNPDPCRIETRGGFWRDALEKGIKMGCIAGSDDHHGRPGLKLSPEINHNNLRYRNPGLTAVLAKELTRESIFEALKNRRCYAASGAKIGIDFRINNNIMGSEIVLENSTRKIYVNVEAEDELNNIYLIKNGKEDIVYNIDGGTKKFKELIYDYNSSRKTDYYYLRVEQLNGRKAWTSPIWIKSN